MEKLFLIMFILNFLNIQQKLLKELLVKFNQVKVLLLLEEQDVVKVL